MASKLESAVNIADTTSKNDRSLDENDLEAHTSAAMTNMGSPLKRDLESRHINMIAIAGMIGTGLFLGSGHTIATAGPVGALLAYIVMGIAAAGISFTTGEITSFSTETGGFVRHATQFVEPALGAATGWNFWYTIAIAVPAEITAATVLVQFWNETINPAVWISIFLVFIVAVNFCGVRLYGETEVIFASLKIMLIIGLIIGGLVIDLGGGPNKDRLGFRFWNEPGAFNAYILTGSAGNFLAFWKSMVPAAFSYGNIQIVAISGSETCDPRRLIPSATKKVCYRILFFYICSIMIVGMIVPYNDPSLQLSSGTASQSPFTIAFQRSGISVVPSIINAVVCTSAISAASACIFIASRTLFGLSCDGHAPKVLQRCNRLGVPYYAVGLTCLPLPLVYLNVANNTSVVFGWFVNITTLAGLIGWIVIEITYLRFYKALKKQGYSRDELPYKGPFQPYLSYFTLILVSLVVLFAGFDVFIKGNFTAAGFITCYLNIAIFIGLYITFKLLLKSKVIKLSDINFQTEFNKIYEERQMESSMQEKTSYEIFGRLYQRLRQALLSRDEKLLGPRDIRGQQVGLALERLLFGDVSPSGHLPVTFPRKLEDAIRINTRIENPFDEGLYVGYKLFDKQGINPLFPFGHGLTYSTFELDCISVSSDEDTVTAVTTLRNTGDVQARQVVQLYIAYREAAEEPPKLLKAFTKCMLDAGDSVNVELAVKTSDLKVWKETTRTWELIHGEYSFMLGFSTGDIQVQKSVETF